LYRDVHVKSDDSYRLRPLLTHRRMLKRKFLDLENEIRHSLKVFGVKLHVAGRGGFDEHVRDAVAGDAFLAAMAEPMLRARAALWAECTRMHALVVQITVHDAVFRRFMSIPGVGPMTALVFKTAVDAPRRFARSRDVGAHFGLTPRRDQSGTSIDFDGHISRQGDKEMRTLLYEAASCLLTRSKVWTSLKALGNEARPASRPQASGHRGGAQTCRHHARDVAGRYRLPLGGCAGSGMTTAR